MAHRFGADSQPYSWALPFIVRSFMAHGRENWTKCPGLKAKMLEDRRLRRQVPAARWLAAHALDLQSSMGVLPAFNVEAGADFSLHASERAPDLRKLFHTLLGRLLGRFDLIVIDEAHKSREGADDRQPSKRLSLLLEEILQPAAGCRRIGLTATPVQLGASDWCGTLGRIGLERQDLDRRLVAIRAFDDVRGKFRSGPASEADVDEICSAARGFQDALADVVVRRRWAEQPIMDRARRVLRESGAHPHRRWDTPPASVAWNELSVEHRMSFLAAEGRGLSAVDTDLGIVERHRAARHAQAMDVLDQPGEDEEPAPSAGHAPESARHVYWRQVQAAWWPSVGLRGDDTLVVHPRVVAACNWIDDVVRREVGKVLVFGAYNRPLQALSDVLNIRCFLREVAAGKPAKPPYVLHQRGGDGDRLIRAVLRCMKDRTVVEQAIAQADGLEALIDRSGRLYDSGSDRLGRAVTNALRVAGVRDGHMRNVIRLAALERVIASGADPKGLKSVVTGLLRALKASAKDDGREDDTRAASDSMLEALHLEEQLSGIGRSDFARVLKGGSSQATRHVLQAMFNTPDVRPHVLLAQSRVASEGLNLHEACRHVLFLHLDWNPAVIEQQLGRVDRVGSYWSSAFEAAEHVLDPPRIEIAVKAE